MTNHPLDDAARFDAERACASPNPEFQPPAAIYGPRPLPNPQTMSALLQVTDELRRATELHPPMVSAHEGYAIILEELDELWLEVMKKPSIRSKEKMLAEAKQVAAMALRFMVDICAETIERRTDKATEAHGWRVGLNTRIDRRVSQRRKPENVTFREPGDRRNAERRKS